MNLDDIKAAHDAADQIEIERQREIDNHASYLQKNMPLHKIESALVDCLQSKLDSRMVISNLFDDSVEFQEWIAEVRDELCSRIAEADLKDYYHDRH